MKGRRFAYLAAAVFAVAGVLLLAGPAGASRQVHATANVHCGDTISANLVMNTDLSCSGTALTIDESGVTLDLGGHTITDTTYNGSTEVIDADWTCGGGSDRCNNVTITDGTVTGGGYQVALGGDNGTISNLTLNDTGTNDNVGVGIYIDEGAGDVITGNSISGADYNSDSAGIYLDYAAGTMVSKNTIGPAAGTYGQGNYYGIYAYYDNGDTIGDNYALKNWEENIYDYEGNAQTYTANVVSGSYDNDGMYLEGDGDGYYTVTGNASRGNADDGIDGYEMYNTAEQSYGAVPPYSLVSGNYTNSNGSDGIYDEESYNATFSNNSSGWNSDYGFDFYSGANANYTGNTAKYNGDGGFYWEYTYSAYSAQTVANNTSNYNGGYGYYVDEYAQGGSNNVGTGNSSGACYGLGGCSGS